MGRYPVVRVSISNLLFSPPSLSVLLSFLSKEKQKKGSKDSKKAKSNGKPKGKADQEEGEEALTGLPYTPCLFDLDLEVCQGALVGVAGPVGGGKSSLVSAIMGEVSRGRSVRVWLSAWLWYYE